MDETEWKCTLPVPRAFLNSPGPSETTRKQTKACKTKIRILTVLVLIDMDLIDRADRIQTDRVQTDFSILVEISGKF